MRATMLVMQIGVESEDYLRADAGAKLRTAELTKSASPMLKLRLQSN